MSCAWAALGVAPGADLGQWSLVAHWWLKGMGFPMPMYLKFFGWLEVDFSDLVAGLVTHVFPEKKRGFHHPNWWTHIFQRGGEKPPTRDNSHVKWGYPYIIHFNGVFHCKPSSYGGTTIYGNPHMDLISEQSDSSTFCWWSWLDPAKVSKLPVVCRDLRLQKAFRSIVATPQKWGCPPIFLPIDPFLAGKKNKKNNQKVRTSAIFPPFCPMFHQDFPPRILSQQFSQVSVASCVPWRGTWAAWAPWPGTEPRPTFRKNHVTMWYRNGYMANKGY